MTLSHMRALRIPANVDWELLVVDNGSADETPQVVESFGDALPIRYLVEPKLGHSNARNCAVRHARGDYILWTDDDVIVDPEWLAAYADAFARWPEAAVFGGVIEPFWDGTPPDWLRENFTVVAGAYALRDLGSEPVPLSAQRLPYGASLAIRATEQRQHPYDPRLGRQGPVLLSGDEVAVVRRIFADGGTGWWVPAARVQHFLPRERQTVRYLRRFFYGIGRGQVIADPEVQPRGRRLLGRPGWMWRDAVQAELRYRRARLSAPPRVWLEALVASSEAWGRLAASRR